MRDHNRIEEKKSLNYPPRLVKTPASAVAVHRPGSSNIYQAIRQTLKHQKNDNNYVNFSGLRQELDSLLSFEGFGCVNIILVKSCSSKGLRDKIQYSASVMASPNGHSGQPWLPHTHPCGPLAFHTSK